MKCERRNSTRKRRLQRFELCVHLDPQGLERPLRRVATRLARCCRHSVVEQLDESARGSERLTLSLGNYPASNLIGVALLTVGSQDSGQLGSRIGIQDLGRGQLLASHSHVEWRILSVGEPAFRIVNLKRGDAEVKQNPLHLRAAES